MKKIHTAPEDGDHLALILQSLGEGIIVLDTDNRIMLMNVRAMEYLDCVPEQSTPHASDILGSCALPHDDFIQFLHNSDQEEIEFEVSTHKGSSRFLKVKKNPVPAIYHNSPEIILLLQDITHDRELDRLKNEFISNLSHELRTPLNAILGISKMLGRKKSENLNARQIEGLDMIFTSGQRLLTLINDLLDLSKMEAGMMLIENESFPIQELIKNLKAYTQALMGDKPITFEITVGPSVPEYMVSDSYRLQQIIMNFLSNAVKYTEQGSIILAIEEQRGNLLFHCTDTGIGIEKDVIPLIFERFRQADGSVSRKYGGTGLGLALSKELALLLEGSISLSSSPGKGTTVTLTLPLRTPDTDNKLYLNREQAVDTSAQASKKQNNKFSVLIVDDEAIDRETMALLLESNYDLVFAADGREAVAQFNAAQPDLVLMDLKMPVMDGYQAMNQIKKNSGEKNIPVIAVTAKAMKGEKEKILKFGFDGYISKPIDDELLMSVIVSHLIKQEGEPYERKF